MQSDFNQIEEWCIKEMLYSKDGLRRFFVTHLKTADMYTVLAFGLICI